MINEITSREIDAAIHAATTEIRSSPDHSSHGVDEHGYCLCIAGRIGKQVLYSSEAKLLATNMAMHLGEASEVALLLDAFSLGMTTAVEIIEARELRTIEARELRKTAGDQA